MASLYITEFQASGNSESGAQLQVGMQPCRSQPLALPPRSTRRWRLPDSQELPPTPVVH